MSGRRITWEGGTRRNSGAGCQSVSVGLDRRPLTRCDAERGRGTIWASAGHRVGMSHQEEIQVTSLCSAIRGGSEAQCVRAKIW